MNMVIVNPNQWARFVPRHNPYVIEVDHSKNCYSCGSFGHIARNYRSCGIVEQRRRMKYKKNSNNGNSDLNGKENLIVLDYILVQIDLQCSLE